MGFLAESEQKYGNRKTDFHHPNHIVHANRRTCPDYVLYGPMSQISGYTVNQGEIKVTFLKLN